MSEEHKHEQQEESEVIKLQKMVNQLTEQHAISMSNELTVMRELVPYLIEERNRLRGVVGNE